jgi:hypothetical protein
MEKRYYVWKFLPQTCFLLVIMHVYIFFNASGAQLTITYLSTCLYVCSYNPWREAFVLSATDNWILLPVLRQWIILVKTLGACKYEWLNMFCYKGYYTAVRRYEFYHPVVKTLYFYNLIIFIFSTKICFFFLWTKMKIGSPLLHKCRRFKNTIILAGNTHVIDILSAGWFLASHDLLYNKYWPMAIRCDQKLLFRL